MKSQLTEDLGWGVGGREGLGTQIRTGGATSLPPLLVEGSEGAGTQVTGWVGVIPHNACSARESCHRQALLSVHWGPPLTLECAPEHPRDVVRMQILVRQVWSGD